jgi:Ca2+-transporting ATPase
VENWTRLETRKTPRKASAVSVRPRYLPLPALTFTTLVVGLLSLITFNRSWSRSVGQLVHSPNAAYRWVVTGAFGFLAAVLYVPELRSIFRFAPLHLAELIICIAAGIVSFFLIELVKLKRT